MASLDALKDKIIKFGNKQKLSAVLKYSDHPDAEIRVTVAMTLAMIPTYDSGMALIPLLRDSDPMVRASAATAAADIHANHCEEYVKKLAFGDNDPTVRATAKEAFDRLKDSVV